MHLPRVKWAVVFQPATSEDILCLEDFVLWLKLFCAAAAVEVKNKAVCSEYCCIVYSVQYTTVKWSKVQYSTVQYSIYHLTSQNLSGHHEILMNIAQYDF